MADKEKEKEGKERPDGRRRANLIHAISQPLRRRILRVFAAWGEPTSPAKIAKELDLPVGMVGYHVRVLHEFDAVEPTGEQMVRGAVEHFYASTIEDDPPIETLLEETRDVDEEDE
jgi:hypothetical protein